MNHTKPRLVALALTAAGLLFSACGPIAVNLPAPSPSGSPTASQNPTPSGSPLPTAANLSGAWVYGDANEPPSGPVVSCNPFRLWNLAQMGNAVTATVNACLGPCGAYQEPSQGTAQAGALHLVGASMESPLSSPSAVSYELSYNAATQHLVGTRNGKPFWAAPFIQQSTDCGARPM
jgi:hypothetical protein